VGSFKSLILKNHEARKAEFYMKAHSDQGYSGERCGP
jgi:hypothetical protein